MKIKACANREEYSSGIELINHVFRITDGHEPTMQNEFPFLLSEENMNRMIIAKEDSGSEDIFSDKAVSIASYLKNPVLVEGTEIMTASIGAVCTYDEYRGRGISSEVLNMLEENMKSEEIDICFVSGTRTLYTRRNFINALSMKKYLLNEALDEDSFDFPAFEMADYGPEYLSDMINVYNQNSTRYRRSYEEFKTIIKTRPHTWGELDYITKLLFKNENLVGYVVLQTISGKDGVVIEAAGDAECCTAAACMLASERKLESLIYEVHERDIKNHVDILFPKYLKNLETETVPNRGTMKIINYVNLMEKLRPYFSEHTEYGNSVQFFESDDRYTISIDDESISIGGIGNISRLVLGYMEEQELDELIGNNSKIAEFLYRCFPIPLPFTENLNYQ